MSKASVGSEPNSVSLVPASGGGSGTSTPPQLLPPSDEKYARIGTRKISFDPAVSMLGLLGLSVTYVSLCGPHSFDTSTFGPTSVEAVRPPPLIGPFWARYRYLFHQVGLCELSAGWAAACGRDGAVASGGSWHATARKLAANATCMVILGIARLRLGTSAPICAPAADPARVANRHPRRDRSAGMRDPREC